MIQPILLDNSFSTDDEPNAVTIELLNHITIIRLSRPHRKNAVDGPTARKLYKAFRQFNSDLAQYVAILVGSDNIFCSGADLHEVSQLSKDKSNSKAHIVDPVNGENLGPMGMSCISLHAVIY